ncbi:MAG: alpha-mannosidase, partial [Verrucomicrobiota bacterium]
MLPQSHLPQLIPNRVNAAVQRLAKNVWTEVEALMPEATQAQPKQVTLSEAKTLKRKAVGECSFWGKLFDQRWCYLKFAEKTDGQTWLFWTDQGEATLYVNNEPYFGFNVAHRSCRLPKGIKEVWIQSSCVQSAIWHPEANGMDAKGSYFEGAWLRKRDDTYWNGYHDLKCFLDLALDQRHRENPQVPTTLAHFGQQPLVDKFSPEYRHMLHGMDLAVDAFDSEGVEAMRKVIADLYKKLRLDQVQSHCILTGHAHLDLVWIWPERIGELKAVNIFASMNHLMGEYPELRFAYSQPASYETVKRREPKLFKHVEQRLSQGQWQATGAMYVESDTMLACGEALSRSFVLGQKGFTELVGKPSTLTWLPDVFGYSACMPQIMQQTG